MRRAIAYFSGRSDGACKGTLAPRSAPPGPARKVLVMKVVHSLKTAKKRDKNCRVVRRRGRVYVINKRNPRFKARQG